ncbi:MAG TPA: hypothetical protein VE127_01170 [Solirubrobacteraceae bacterium]|nr:hypothetical protein [Solirubrobacteraceae bacterium]
MPHPINHQITRLSRGSHGSPEAGACAMELASMLADEPFSDRPRCVSPAIGGFLRAYNDLVDDDLRQDLYGVVSDVVGSRGTHEVERVRVRRVVEWGRAMRRRRGLSLMLLPAREPTGTGGRIDADEAGIFAVRAIGRHRREAHPAALAFIGELVAVGGRTNGRRNTDVPVLRGLEPAVSLA